VTLPGKRAAAGDYQDTCKRQKRKRNVPLAVATWNMQGVKADNSGNLVWDRVKDWVTSNADTEANGNPTPPYRLSIGCFQESGTPSVLMRGFPHTHTLTATDEQGATIKDDKNKDVTATVTQSLWVFSERFVDHTAAVWVYHFDWPGPKGLSAGGGRVNQTIVSTTEHTELEFIYHQAELRPLIGAKINDAWYFTLHAPSGTGGDGWWLVNQVSVRHPNEDWWVLGDYNLQPEELQKKFKQPMTPTQPAINIDAVICEPDKITRPASGMKYDYAVRNEGHLTGHVHDAWADRSDHVIVFYPLPPTP